MALLKKAEKTKKAAPARRTGNEDKGMSENKSRALEAALGQIEKQFGKGAIMRLGDNQALEPSLINI